MSRARQILERANGRGARLLVAVALVAGVSLGTSGHASEADLLQRMQRGGHVLMIRHALAPGTGDPADFRIDDCSTQRNLDARGREQARAMGEWLRSRGIARARVYSSQWCRCLETAELLGLGAVAELPALNSFYERSADRDGNLGELRGFLARQPLDGELLVLVTHQVTVAAMSGRAASSGEGMLLALRSDTGPEFIAAMPFNR
jgi:phosphohistidine phosphatase SixA